MNRLIKTLYFWFATALACNLLSLLVGHFSHILPKGALLFIPVAGVMQIPLILAIALPHYFANVLIDLTPERIAKKAQWIACTLLLFIYAGIYLSSQIMRSEIGTFLSWDMLGVALSDTKQILPDIGKRIGIHLLVLIILTGLIGFAFVRHYRNVHRKFVIRKFAITMGITIGLCGTSYAMLLGSSKPTAWRIQYDLFPTTFLATTWVDNLLMNDVFKEEAIETIVMEPRISLDQYLENNSPEKTPNVFFIVLESIPWNHFPFTGYNRQEITPTLSALANDCTIFPSSYSTASHSSYAQPGIHASQYPLRSPSLNTYGTVDYPKTMLFDILGNSGYQTAFISAQNEEWQGMKRFIQADSDLQYFYHSKDELGETVGTECKLDDKIVCTRAIEYMEQREPQKPTFLYMNLQRTHFPYDIPEEADRPYQPCNTDEFQFTFFSFERDKKQTVINKYDNALHYVDTQIGLFIDYLKTNGLYENSIIVVVPDHGEAFYEHGLPTHGTSLYDHQIRVCTLFKEPNQHTSIVRNDPISLIDLNPSILECLGMKNYPSFQGHSILNTPRTQPIFFLCHGIRKGIGILDYPWKFVYPETRPPRLTNLEIDPDEKSDLTSKYPEKAMELKKTLEIFRHQQLYYYMDLPSEKRADLFPPRL